MAQANATTTPGTNAGSNGLEPESTNLNWSGVISAVEQTMKAAQAAWAESCTKRLQAALLIIGHTNEAVESLGDSFETTFAGIAHCMSHTGNTEELHVISNALNAGLVTPTKAETSKPTVHPKEPAESLMHPCDPFIGMRRDILQTKPAQLPSRYFEQMGEDDQALSYADALASWLTMTHGNRIMQEEAQPVMMSYHWFELGAKSAFLAGAEKTATVEDSQELFRFLVVALSKGKCLD